MIDSNILIYQSEDGETKIQARLEDETVWLSQTQLSELFQKSKSTISEHIKNVFDEEKLDENSVVRNFRTTASDGKIYNKEFEYFLNGIDDFYKFQITKFISRGFDNG